MPVLLIVLQPDVIPDCCITKHHNEHGGKVMEDHDNDTVGVTTTLVALPGLQALAASVGVVLDPGIEEGGDGDGQGQDPDDDDDEQRVLGGNPFPERVHDDDVSVDAHGHESVSTEKHGHDL